MMLEITERCTMGCSHCMNDAKPCGKDMDDKVLEDSLEFIRDNRLGTHLIVTGGEPTEHSDFDKVIKRIIDFSGEFSSSMFISVTTNGETIQKDPDRFKGYVKRAKDLGIVLMFQVSADVRYYPRRIETHKRIFREDGFVLCDNCVEQIYPQGRALDNNIPWKAKASKCFNVRALSKQLHNPTLEDIINTLAARLKFCTPHIGIKGDIKLGESDLCPSCASIYDDMSLIIHKIQNFKCNKCEHINSRLSDMYKSFL